jgi:lipoate-protein ligase A
MTDSRGPTALAVELWCDGAHPPAENMRRDAALLAAASEGRLPRTVVRLFAFEPHGITLGMSQDPATELDMAALEAAGVPWAVRPTGGRAIYHAQEWTFSLTTTLGESGWAADARAAYARTGEWLARALHRLGAPVQLARADHGDLAPRSAAAAAPPCFASTARHELTLEGRKFAGIAQRRVGNALLQQGSLLLGDGHLRLVEFQALAAPAREQARQALAAASADVSSWVGGATRLEDLAAALEATCETAPVTLLLGEAGLHAYGIA